MAPTTRSSRASVAKSVSRKPRPDRSGPTNEWSFSNRQAATARGEAEEDEDEDEDDEPLAIENGEPDVQMDSLRALADRVGKEVESFAETLDQFMDHLPTVQDRYDAAHDLALDFKAIAEKSVEDLKKTHGREQRLLLRKEWGEDARISTMKGSRPVFEPTLSTSFGGGAMAAKKRQQVEELRRFQEEADTWELFRLVLELHHNPNAAALAQEKHEKLQRLGNVHRYTSENELYDRFLIENDLARERALIKTWLEQTAEHQRSDLQGIVEELETRAGSKAGTWSRGWMHTREKIKAEKRLRTWPTPDSSPLPQINRSDNKELLATSLDPDAPGRQNRALEKEDAFVERVLWVACWEMLRRGKPWSEVCDWCEERKEGWRAVAMGKALATSDTASNVAWRKICYIASQSGAVEDYEAAVYGLLGGNVDAVKKISRSVDDHMYAHFSAVLTHQFDRYLLENFPSRVPEALSKRGLLDESVFNPAQAQADISNLVRRLRKDASTHSETVFPFKMLQSYLLNNDIDSAIHTVGWAAQEVQGPNGDKRDIFDRVQALLKEQPDAPEASMVTEPHSLRILAHIAIVIQTLRGGRTLPEEEQAAEDHVIDAYIHVLRAAGKRDMIPLYASLMQKERYRCTMARVMEDVRASSERGIMIDLMLGRGMEVVDTLDFLYVNTLTNLMAVKAHVRGVNILEPYTEKDHWPGQRIKLGSLPSQVGEYEDEFVMSLQWLQRLKGYWMETFYHFGMALRKLLITGRFAAARALVQHFPYDDISQQKSYQVIGRSVNLASGESSRPGDKQAAARWDQMFRESRTYYQLEQLVHAFEALNAWRTEESKYSDLDHKPKLVPGPMKHYFELAEAAMQPLLEKDFLLMAQDEDEALDLAHIRDLYLPEAIIAYNTALHTAGYMITRHYFITSMDLAVLVAKEELGLTQTFVNAGRMRELVTSFALSSKAMLSLRETGHKPWKPKKDREGKDGGIWEVGTKEIREGEIEVDGDEDGDVEEVGEEE